MPKAGYFVRCQQDFSKDAFGKYYLSAASFAESCLHLVKHLTKYLSKNLAVHLV
jgi:hypothetical protein